MWRNYLSYLQRQYPDVEFRLVFKYGADESSGYKDWNFQNKKKRKAEDDPESPPPAKKACKCPPKKETKSLFSSQGAVVGITAKLDQETKILFENENANSIFVHFPIKHEYGWNHL